MPSDTYQEIEISSSFSQARQAEQTIVTAAENHGYVESDLFALQLSLEEALSNAIRHGNRQDSQKIINIRYHVSQERIDIYVADEGTGFDPTNVPDPTADENLENPHGRGIMLMRAYMNLVEYNQEGNVVHIVKLNPKSTKSSCKNHE